MDVVEQLRDELTHMQENGKIKLSNQIYYSVDDLIKDGVRNLGIYHPEKTLVFNKKGQLISQNFKLLFLLSQPFGKIWPCRYDHVEQGIK